MWPRGSGVRQGDRAAPEPPRVAHLEGVKPLLLVGVPGIEDVLEVREDRRLVSLACVRRQRKPRLAPPRVGQLEEGFGRIVTCLLVPLRARTPLSRRRRPPRLVRCRPGAVLACEGDHVAVRVPCVFVPTERAKRPAKSGEERDARAHWRTGSAGQDSRRQKLTSRKGVAVGELVLGDRDGGGERSHFAIRVHKPRLVIERLRNLAELQTKLHRASHRQSSVFRYPLSLLEMEALKPLRRGLEGTLGEGQLSDLARSFVGERGALEVVARVAQRLVRGDGFAVPPRRFERPCRPRKHEIHSLALRGFRFARGLAVGRPDCKVRCGAPGSPLLRRDVRARRRRDREQAEDDSSAKRQHAGRKRTLAQGGRGLSVLLTSPFALADPCCRVQSGGVTRLVACVTVALSAAVALGCGSGATATSDPDSGVLADGDTVAPHDGASVLADGASLPPDEFKVHNLDVFNMNRAMLNKKPLVLDAKLSAFALAGSTELSMDHMPHQHFITALNNNTLEHAGFGSDEGENQGDPTGWTVLAPFDPTKNELAQIDAIQLVMFNEGPAGDAGEHDHYLNIIKTDYTRLGVGLLEVGGRLYLTNDFSN